MKKKLLFITMMAVVGIVRSASIQGDLTVTGDLTVSGGDLNGTPIKKHNYNATAAPTVTDDSSIGYTIGSLWVDHTNNKTHMCHDATTGAAVWTDLTAAGGGGAHSGLTGLGADDHPQYALTDGTRAFTGAVTIDGTITAADDVTLSPVDDVFISPGGGLTTITGGLLDINTAATFSSDLTLEGAGNIVLGTGLVDGRDVSADGTKLDTLTLGTTVQAWNARLDDVAGIIPGTVGNAIVSDGIGGWSLASLTARRTQLNVEDGADVTDAASVAAAGALMDTDITSNGVIKRTGAGTYTTRLDNENASVDPATSDDAGAGYTVGSRWYNTTENTEFVCLDATAAAAVWVATTASGTDPPLAPFTVLVIPDTQDMAKNSATALDTMYQWIADNYVAYGVSAVLHVGDHVNDNTATQWDRITDAVDLLPSTLPFLPAAGNHDGQDGLGYTFPVDWTAFNTAFPESDFNNKPWWGGIRVPGDTENMFFNITLGGEQWCLFSLEWAAPDAELAWLESTLDANPTKKFLIVTHDFVTGSNTLRNDHHGQTSGTDLNDAAAKWEALKDHPNIKLIVSGHELYVDWAVGSASGPDGVGRMALVGDQQNTVHGVLQNWQALAVSGPEADQYGVVRLFTYYPGSDKWLVRTVNTVTEIWSGQLQDNFNLDHTRANALGNHGWYLDDNGRFYSPDGTYKDNWGDTPASTTPPLDAVRFFSTQNTTPWDSNSSTLWKDGGTAADDLTGSATTLTIGGGYDFDGASSEMASGTGTQSGWTGGTWAFWFRETATDSFNTIASYDSAGQNAGDGQLYSASGLLKYYVQSSSATFEITANTAHSLNEWHCVVVSCGAAGLRMSIDGVLQADVDATTQVFNHASNTFMVGKYFPGSSNVFEGQLDTGAVFDYQLTDTEMNKFWTTGRDFTND